MKNKKEKDSSIGVCISWPARVDSTAINSWAWGVGGKGAPLFSSAPPPSPLLDSVVPPQPSSHSRHWPTWQVPRPRTAAALLSAFSGAQCRERSSSSWLLLALRKKVVLGYRRRTANSSLKASGSSQHSSQFTVGTLLTENSPVRGKRFPDDFSWRPMWATISSSIPFTCRRMQWKLDINLQRSKDPLILTRLPPLACSPTLLEMKLNTRISGHKTGP